MHRKLEHLHLSFWSVMFGLYILLSCNKQTPINAENLIKIITETDRICNNIDTNKLLLVGISEGVNKNNSGGWDTYDFKNRIGGTLYKIVHNSFIDSSRETFYYNEMKVIKAIVFKESEDLRSSIKNKQITTFYFDNNKPLILNGEIINSAEVQEILKRGIIHQKKFYERNKRYKYPETDIE